MIGYMLALSVGKNIQDNQRETFENSLNNKNYPAPLLETGTNRGLKT
jgi:hypothetical protein